MCIDYNSLLLQKIIKSKYGNRLKLNRIKDVLESKGISQTWLAKQIGKEFCTVNAYCGQRVQPNLTTLYRIAEILNVDFKDLITDKNDR